MTAVSTADGKAAPEPWYPRLNIPWPAGTWWFALRTWVALALALYAAFWLQLDGASSAGVCVLILAQPAQGMVLSKSIYRIIGTLVGVTVAIILTALFPQDRTMLLASFAVFMAMQTAVGSVLRDFRSYAGILAGYTVAIISIANIDAPTATFEAAINRVAAILVGVTAIAIINSVMATAESSESLIGKLRAATKDVVAMALAAIEDRKRPEVRSCVLLSARLMPLRSEISFATPEKPDGRDRAKGARSALLGLFEMISAIQAVGAGLSHLETPSSVVDEALDIARKALRIQNPEKCLPALETLALPAIKGGTLAVEEAYVLDRLHFMIKVMGDIRNGLLSLRIGQPPRRNVTIEVHQDWFAVVLNAVRVVVAIGIVSALAVMSGIADTATAILFTAVFVSLGAVLPDPSVMGKAAIFGMPAVVVAGAVYSFFIFPNIDGYPLFIIALAPIIVIMCWFIKIGMPGAGLIFGVQTIVLIAPANVQTLNPPAFVETASMLAVSGIAIFLAFLLILPVDPAQRRLRLALAVGTNLRKALADEAHLQQPRASLQYDRLAQFKTWQRDETVTTARRKTAKRLLDIGNLAFAVRRSWRSLDAARDTIDPDVDARARKVLPSLSPDETLELAKTYLAAARGKSDGQALALVHASAALYGTQLVTNDELRLLKHVELLRRKI